MSGFHNWQAVLTLELYSRGKLLKWLDYSRTEYMTVRWQFVKYCYPGNNTKPGVLIRHSITLEKVWCDDITCKHISYYTERQLNEWGKSTLIGSSHACSLITAMQTAEIMRQSCCSSCFSESCPFINTMYIGPAFDMSNLNL